MCVLLCVRYTLAPLMTEYLQPNSRPLTITLYQGSITEAEPCTKGYDLITCIEVWVCLDLLHVLKLLTVSYYSCQMVFNLIIDLIIDFTVFFLSWSMEHLHLREVERFSEILFEYMEPRSVIISMPNAEFNPLLPGLTGFRHKDHKFEWTRAQFQCWWAFI